MLNKMVKYDLLFGLKGYGILFLLLFGTWLSGIIVSLIGNSYLNVAFFSFNIVATIILLGAYAITSIQFFYNSMSGDESYLSYTIPTNTFSLVFSKFAAIWMWGGAVVLALVLAWVSLYHTLLAKMDMMFSIPPKILDTVISVAVPQFFMISCILAFSVSICNTPKMKSTNIGILVSVGIAYLLTQAMGIIQTVTWGLYLFLKDSEVFHALLEDRLAPEQEPLVFTTMKIIFPVLSVILMVLFFWLTVRTVEKKRSI